MAGWVVAGILALILTAITAHGIGVRQERERWERMARASAPLEDGPTRGVRMRSIRFTR